MTDWQVVEGGVTAAQGFRAAGITAGLKPSGAADLALIVSDHEPVTAGVYTTSQVRAAPVDYCRQQLAASPTARAILVNAGQANACTGDGGWQDTVLACETLATALGIPSQSVLMASTGVIGQRIKMTELLAAIPTLVASLTTSGSPTAARAILTTDLVPKTIAVETVIDGQTVRIGGIAKGSGMICPNMATMLAFVTCDAAVDATLWQTLLQRAVARSFNQITVDGDTSTNDCVLAMANGASGIPTISTPGLQAERLEAALTAVCQHLAKAVARDGEGATCLLTVQVSGARNDEGARQIAKSIAGSSLLKCAVFGHDPNWGRIAMAAGKAGVAFDQGQLRVQLGEFLLMTNGQPQAFDRTGASDYLKQATHGEYLHSDSVEIQVSVGDGPGSGSAWGCDFSYDYVKINAEYTT